MFIWLKNLRKPSKKKFLADVWLGLIGTLVFIALVYGPYEFTWGVLGYDVYIFFKAFLCIFAALAIIGLLGLISMVGEAKVAREHLRPIFLVIDPYHKFMPKAVSVRQRDLVAALLTRAGHPADREKLLAENPEVGRFWEVWPMTDEGDDNTIAGDEPNRLTLSNLRFDEYNLVVIDAVGPTANQASGPTTHEALMWQDGNWDEHLHETNIELATTVYRRLLNYPDRVRANSAHQLDLVEQGLREDGVDEGSDRLAICRQWRKEAAAAEVGLDCLVNMAVLKKAGENPPEIRQAGDWDAHLGVGTTRGPTDFHLVRI